MDGGDIYRAGNSLRATSSTTWTNHASIADVFSRSSRDEDDEEAPRWAALEELPTFERLQKGILTAGGGANQIDIWNLGFHDRKRLLERVGIDLPTIEVRFDHLKVEAEAHEGSRALPTVINFCTSILEGFLNFLHVLPRRKKHLTILQDVSGIIKPGRMTLLLGPPSSGKTTLLLALAGKLDPELKTTGRVTYNGHVVNEFVPQRTAAYISQHDLHIGEMTVRETLAFSARCQGVGSRYAMLSKLSRREKAANIKPDPDIDIFMKAVVTEGQEANVVIDYILKILGLEICDDVMVGDEMLRGISGGQRKRVTTGEMLVGPAEVFLMDEISTGLDSSTTYQIVNFLKQFIHILDGTAVISLLQPAPETYDLFDDIILLSDGQIVYQGPRELVLDFFKSMGFKCPRRKGVADFLQEVTSRKDQHQYWVRKDEPYTFVTVREFVEAFQSFHVGRKLGDELSTPFDKSKNHPAALTTKRFGVGMKDLLKACILREYLLMKRNSFVYIFKVSQLIIMAFISTTLFLRTKMHRDIVTDGGVYIGALFFTVITIMFNGMSEISMTIPKLPIFYKQRDLLFYPAWAYALPSWILKIPITFVEVAAWVFITYYVTGYHPNVGRLFKQYLLLVAINQMASGLFRLIAALGRNLIVANTFGSFVLLALVALGGVVLSREDVKKWWIWGYWTSPLMYGQNAIVVNEFLGSNWNKFLSTRACQLKLHVNAAFGKSHKVKSDDPEGNKNVDRIEGSIQLQSRGSSLRNGSGRSSKPTPPWPETAVAANTKRGMVLPFEPHSITFDKITYSVDMPREMKNQGAPEERLVLLKGVSGAFRPGVLTALMGISGAGKTTLMDVLAGRKTGGYIKGNITISGYPKNQDTFARISGYCEQNDIHSPHVTVYESLIYSAWLRLPPGVDDQTRKLFVEEVMELVELNPLRQALVGLPGVDGLSIEQRKRLTIAVELVANPSIIFMDEPTSGLDARAAAIVMRTVRNTVDTGRTVVCTIHQPSIDIFESFDEGIQGVSKIKDGYNPATWMLEVTSPAQELALGVDFSDLYKNSDLYRRNKALIEELSIPPPNSKDLYFPTKYSQSTFTQLMACLWKQHWSYWRNPPYTAVRFLFTISIAIMFGTMFWDLGSKTTRSQDLFNAMGSMYAALVFLGIQNASSVQPVVAVERTVFYRERAAGMYSALPYALAQVLIEVPYVLMQAISYGIIVYVMIGFKWTVAKFFWYLFFMFFTLLYFTYYGMMAVGMTPNHHIASIVSFAFYAIWNLFSGFVVPRTKIPIWWRWFYWVCPVSWTLYGLVVSQFGDLTNTLEDTGDTVEEYMRDYFGYRHDFLGVIAAVMIGFTMLFAFVFAVSIKILNFQRR
ncbi:hypothetical protein EUGRSUZ_H02564 [Eucalyptus grandis]|uniref:Uncharacterized protein n=2 Tax=Eucalyptus grandis TaxID=71139 RepID=A0ACC3JSW6_EUCGR|nr:hypothetical protein EUGRSUZ_H02564 [Eucalyptus grandis]